MATATLEKVETTTETKPEKVYKYYGIEYTASVTEQAAVRDVSLRTMKTFLELKAMGYQPHIPQTLDGRMKAQCYAHAGRPKRKPAPTRAEVEEYKAVIIAKREDLADAEYEIQRLREMVIELGGDLDKF